MPLLQNLIDPLLALTPVALFLLGLVYLDSFKLVGPWPVLGAIVAGAGAALGALWLNPVLIGALSWDFSTYTRYGSPWVEELLKAVPLVWLLARNRIGFPVDAAIFGFAVGTGFAMAENVYYLGEHPGARAIVWLVRGFGTALLHGGAAAAFTILVQVRADRSSGLAAALLPAWLAAVVIHSFYNHFFLSPLASTLLILTTLPLLVGALFVQSEQSLRRWLGEGFDADADLVGQLQSGRFRESHAGEYLERLRRQFEGRVVADMLCLLQIHRELALRAKARLIAREAGVDVPLGPDVRENLNELRFLEKSVGKTGRLALTPLLTPRSRDLWQLSLLEQ